MLSPLLKSEGSERVDYSASASSNSDSRYIPDEPSQYGKARKSRRVHTARGGPLHESVQQRLSVLGHRHRAAVAGCTNGARLREGLGTVLDLLHGDADASEGERFAEESWSYDAPAGVRVHGRVSESLQ